MESKYRCRLVGKKFGKLTVVGFAGLIDGKRTAWNCQCECGGKKVARNDSLQQGHTTSCGCAANLRGSKSRGWQGYGEISSSYWGRLQRGAVIRKLDFTVTVQEAWALFIKQNRRCALSHLPIEFGEFTKDFAAKSASLDRVDSNKGYVLGNVQWVDKRVNFMKQSLPQQEFIELCRQITQHAGIA